MHDIKQKDYMLYPAIKYKINKTILPSERVIKTAVVAIMLISLVYAIVLHKLPSTICAIATIVVGVAMIGFMNRYMVSKSYEYIQETIQINDEDFILTNQIYENGIDIEFDKISKATLSTSPKAFLLEGNFTYEGKNVEHVMFFDLYEDEVFDLVLQSLESRDIEVIQIAKPSLPQADINLREE